MLLGNCEESWAIFLRRRCLLYALIYCAVRVRVCVRAREKEALLSRPDKQRFPEPAAIACVKGDREPMEECEREMLVTRYVPAGSCRQPGPRCQPPARTAAGFILYIGFILTASCPNNRSG